MNFKEALVFCGECGRKLEYSEEHAALECPMWHTLWGLITGGWSDHDMHFGPKPKRPQRYDRQTGKRL